MHPVHAEKVKTAISEHGAVKIFPSFFFPQFYLSLVIIYLSFVCLAHNFLLKFVAGCQRSLVETSLHNHIWVSAGYLQFLAMLALHYPDIYLFWSSPPFNKHKCFWAAFAVDCLFNEASWIKSFVLSCCSSFWFLCPLGEHGNELTQNVIFSI